MHYKYIKCKFTKITSYIYKFFVKSHKYAVIFDKFVIFWDKQEPLSLVLDILVNIERIKEGG